MADGEQGALIGPRGDLAWLCAPRWIGCRVLQPDRRSRRLRRDPQGTALRLGGYYEGSTLIWRSRWITSSGFTECREALAYPGDPHTTVVLRRVVALDGPARVRVVLDLRAGFGRCRMSQLKQAGGLWTARSGPLRVRWSGGADATVRADGALGLHLALDAGAIMTWSWRYQTRPCRVIRCRPRKRGRPPRRPRRPPSRSSARAWPPGQPAQLCGAGRANQQHRRDGRRGHHVAAGAFQGRPELRPLRLDPGPVLRRPGRGRRRRPPAGRRRLVRG